MKVLSFGISVAASHHFSPLRCINLAQTTSTSTCLTSSTSADLCHVNKRTVLTVFTVFPIIICRHECLVSLPGYCMDVIVLAAFTRWLLQTRDTTASNLSANHTIQPYQATAADNPYLLSNAILVNQTLAWFHQYPGFCHKCGTVVFVVCTKRHHMSHVSFC